MNVVYSSMNVKITFITYIYMIFHQLYDKKKSGLKI